MPSPPHPRSHAAGNHHHLLHSHSNPTATSSSSADPVPAGTTTSSVSDDQSQPTTAHPHAHLPSEEDLPHLRRPSFGSQPHLRPLTRSHPSTPPVDEPTDSPLDRMSTATPGAIPYSRPHTPSPHGLPQYGFIGLGNMGFEMALNLARSLPAGAALTVWNRSRDKSERLLASAGEEKVRIASSPQEVVQRCYVVITSLGTDAAVEETYKVMYEAHEAKEHQTTGGRVRSTIFIDTSTIYPTLAAKLDTSCSASPHRHFLMCPVFGPPAAAKSAQLVLVLAGAHAAKKEVAYALVPAVGRKIIDVGENVERAASFKLIGNGMVIGAIEMLSEAMTMADKSGLGADLFYSFVKEMFPAPSFIGYGAKILNDDFDGSKGFNIEGGLKDAGHIRRLVEEKSSPMPMVDIAHQHMLTARAYAAKQKRWKELDWSAMVIGQRLASGLEPLDPKGHTGPVLEEN